MKINFWTSSILAVATSLILVQFSFAQNKASSAPLTSQNLFVTPIDQDLRIKTISLLPVVDNVGGIYAKPIEEELNQLITSDSQWSLNKFTSAKKININTLSDNPNDVAPLFKESGSDALLVASLTKGTRGINGSLSLYAGHEGLLFLQENLTDFKGFDIAEVRLEFKRLYTQLKAKMPFKGMILSRRGQQVTLNLGKNYGLKPNMNITVIQIVKINRHPKLNFMVSSEKEILGRVQLTQVDTNLSFGSVVYEREPGVITVGSKIIPEEYVKYATPVLTPDGKVLTALGNRSDKDLAFGENPTEWKPEPPPQFGKVGILAGVSSYEQNSDLKSAGSVTGKNGLAPNIAVNGEIWLNSNWYIGFHLRQSIFSVSNDLNGSAPSRLNMSLGQYGVSGGYNFLLNDDFFGPKLQVSTGFDNSKFSVDSSTPLALTTASYSGFILGLAGQFPLSNELPLDLGAKYNFWISPTLSEDSSSGSSSNSVSSFSFFVDYRLRPRFKIKTELDFEYYHSSFSGNATRPNPAASTSHKLTTLLLGLEYLF